MLTQPVGGAGGVAEASAHATARTDAEELLGAQESAAAFQPVSSSTTSVWDFVLRIIVADDTRYGERPEVLTPTAARQIFVERPPKRRRAGCDRWRFSGGQRGATDLWIHNRIGLRKRYGKIIQANGNSRKFLSFSVLRHPVAHQTHEDRSAVVYVVDGDREYSPPRSSPRAVPSQPYQQLDPEWPQEAGSISTIDLSAYGCRESISRLPRRLPVEHADVTCQFDSPTLQEVPSIDANVTLSQTTRPTSSWIDLDEVDCCSPDMGSEKSTVQPDDDFYSDHAFDAFSSSDGSSLVLDDFDCTRLFLESYTGHADFSYTCTPGVTQLRADNFDVEATSAASWQNWYTENTSRSQQQPTRDAPMDRKSPIGSSQVKLKQKRKYMQLQKGSTSPSGDKTACSRRLAGVAVLGFLCVVLGGLGSQAGDDGFASFAADSAGQCAAGPARIVDAVTTESICPEGTQGSHCPYDCSPGFKKNGLHACTRDALGRFRYTGGACIPSNPCERVTLVDSGVLTLSPGSTLHHCSWDLVCTNTSLAPTLDFAGFNMGNGYLSFSGDTLSEKLGGTAQTMLGPDSPRFVAIRENLFGEHKRERGSPNASAPDEIILRGDEPWWISQKSIRVASKPTASVVYRTDTSRSAMPDSFVAAFSCGPFEELCTATDTMELDWVSVLHAPPAGFVYPANVAQWGTLFNQMGWPATSACASSPCMHGTCVDSDGQQAYSEQTAFGFVCNCYPSWSGELCDEKPVDTEQQHLPCTTTENDCDAAVSSCAVLGPGQRECICFPGFANVGESPALKGKRSMHSKVPPTRCQLEVEDPPVGASWVSGPGYEAFGGVVVGSFEATVGESPAYLQASSLITSSAFFDPAAYNQVFLNTPPRADGCSIDAYAGPGPAAVDMEFVMILSSDGGCPLWLKVIIAQRMGAKSVIIYGDGIPEGRTISWAIDDPARLARAIDDPYEIGGTAQQLGLACVSVLSSSKLTFFTPGAWTFASCQVPTIFVGQKQGEVLRRAALAGITWVELHCGRAQLIQDQPRNLSPAMPWPPTEVCASSPCENGGTCVSGADPTSLHRSGTTYVFSEYTCSCPADFTGEHCENSRGQSTCVDDPTWRNTVTGAGCEEYKPTQWCQNCSTLLTDNNCIIDQGQVGSNDQTELAIKPINRVAYAYEACPVSCGICKPD